MVDLDIQDHPAFWKTISRFGLSDAAELIEHEKQTRPARIEQAFRRGAQGEPDPGHCDQQLFDRMWLGEDLEQVNAALQEDLTRDLTTLKAHKEDPKQSPAYGLYHLSRNARLLSYYFCFASGSRLFPGRLSASTQALLVELLWWRTQGKNDIAIARRSTWWIGGSENHDLNTKTTNLLVSAILAGEPGYADRPLPNRGYGCAPGYHQAGYNPQGASQPHRVGTGRANWSDGRPHTAAEHYAAWVEHLKTYFTERAKKGFFLEHGAPGYMRYTISYILLVCNFCPDATLRRQAGMFLDLFWADWALLQLGGLRGGPKTRHHHSAGQYDAMSDWARFHLGGPGLTTANYAQQLLGDYAWDPIIWELLLDRQGAGEFAYMSRGIGEEEETCPRPGGVERAMMGDRESRMVRYNWITPDYVLGTQMDHPLAMHNHLSAAGRWQGLVTADLGARIATVSLEPFPGKTRPGNAYCMELMYHSVQDRQVLITQQKRRWMQINPDWFPSNESIHDVPFGLFIGDGWSNRVEQEGWLFLEQANTYAAIRVLRLKADVNPLSWATGTDPYEHSVEQESESYTWDQNDTLLRLVNKFSPIIIEAGRRADYPTLADFQRQILANKLEIYRTVVTRETRIIIVYKGAEAREIVFNAANHADIPTVDGQPIDYRYPLTFDAPYLRAAYDSGVVEITKGDRRQVLDFNRAERQVVQAAGATR